MPKPSRAILLIMKRRDIQVYRAISVTAVLLYHSNLPVFKWLYLGVDAFFVISGYLMASLYLNESAKKFYSRRISRLFPSLILTLVFVNLYSCWRIFPLDYHAVLLSSLFSAIGLANLYLVSQQSYFDTVNFQPLLHLWSLAVEIQFYLVTPLIFKLYRKFRNLFLGTLAVLSLIIAVLTQVLVSEKYSFFLPFGRAWEFIAGILAFTLIKPIRGKAFGFAAIMVISIMAILPEVYKPQLVRVTICLVLVMLLRSNFTHFLNYRYALFPVWLGGISYELYLVHFPLTALINYEPLTSNQTKSIDNPFDWIIYIAGSIILATLLKRLSEISIRKRGPFLFNSILISALVLISFSVAKPIIIHGAQAATLSSSLEDYNRRRCNLIERIREYSSKVCLVTGSRENPKRILLVGDSFANSLKDEIETISNLERAALYINKNNSQFIDGEMFSTLKYSKEIAAEVLILHSSRSLDTSQSAQLESFALENPSIRFVIIGPTPIFKFNVAKQVNSEIQTGQPTKRVLARDLANAEELLNFKPIKGENIINVSLLELLCSPDCKYSNSDSSANYFDNGHITNKGSQILQPMFLEVSHFLR